MLQGIAPCVTISKEKLSRKLGKGAEKIIKGLMKVEKKELKKIPHSKKYSKKEMHSLKYSKKYS